jgi:hypothetical protein
MITPLLRRCHRRRQGLGNILHEWKQKIALSFRIAITAECYKGFVVRFSLVIIPLPHHLEENNNILADFMWQLCDSYQRHECKSLEN